MAINDWWSSRPNERYWMEITNRSNLGSNLIAPMRTRSGQETFSYTLVSHVKPGDVVFHWWIRPGGEPAIVGYSTAAGDWFPSVLEWEPHAGAKGGAVTSEAFEVPLTDFTTLQQELTLSDLRRQNSATLRRIHQGLEQSVDGPLYFPWVFSSKRPIRTTQGYLVKMPADVVAAFPQLGEARKQGSTPSFKGTRGLGRQQDPEVRRAIERHAVDWTMDYYRSLHCVVKDVGDVESFDVLVTEPDGSEIHVEVKGSSTKAVAVELTDGEVQHRGPGYRRALVVVDDIEWQRSHGKVKTSGGTPRIWSDWELDPQDQRLVPTRYRYTLPGGEDLI